MNREELIAHAVKDLDVERIHQTISFLITTEKGWFEETEAPDPITLISDILKMVASAYDLCAHFKSPEPLSEKYRGFSATARWDDDINQVRSLSFEFMVAWTEVDCLGEIGYELEN